MISNSTRRQTIVRTGTLELDANDVLELLTRAGHIPPTPAADTSLRVYFAVPGGGDWSNTDIDISKEHPIYVGWKITVESDSAG